MNIGVIPARAGSKRLPGKNRQKLNGKELWKRALEMSSVYMERTIVNTDDMEIIADESIRFEFYKRPDKLAGDNIRMDDVLIEMAKKLKFKDEDIIFLFQPTSPFVDSESVTKAIVEIERDKEADSVQTVLETENIYHAYGQRFKDGKYLKFAFPELRHSYYNSQLKPQHYVFAGLVGCRVGSLLKHKDIWGINSIGIMAYPLEALDIDTEEDLEIARSVIAAGIAI